MSDDLHARVMQLEQAGAAQRLTALEVWRQQSDIADARRQEQWTNLKEKLDGVLTSVNDIKGTLTWIVRLVIGAIVLAAVAFTIKGGFNMPL